MFPHAIWNEELCILRPAINTLGAANFIFAQGLTVSFFGVLLFGGSISNVAVNNNECRSVVSLLKYIDGAGQQFQVVGIAYPRDVPAISHKSGSDIFTECQLGFAFNGDVVIVIKPAEIAQLEMARERCRLTGDALHHVPIATDGIHVVIEQLSLWRVEMCSLPLGGNRHAYTVGHTLAQRAGGGLNARSEPIFGMSRAFAVKLAEMLDVVHGDGGCAQSFILGIYRLDPGKMEQRIQQHGGVSVGKDKAVTIG